MHQQPELLRKLLDDLHLPYRVFPLQTGNLRPHSYDVISLPPRQGKMAGADWAKPENDDSVSVVKLSETTYRMIDQPPVDLHSAEYQWIAQQMSERLAKAVEDFTQLGPSMLAASYSATRFRQDIERWNREFFENQRMPFDHDSEAELRKFGDVYFPKNGRPPEM